MATVQEMPISATGVTSEIASERANWVVVRNSRILIGIVYFGSLCSYAMGVCFLLIALGTLTSHAFRWGNLYAAATWVIAGLSTILSGPWLWSLGRKMAFNEARLDSRGRLNRRHRISSSCDFSRRLRAERSAFTRVWTLHA